MKIKPCTECWVEAQRRELVTGEDPDETYRALLVTCPMFHDATQTSLITHGEGRWARS